MIFNFVIVCDTYRVKKNNIGVFLLDVSIDKVPNVEEGSNVYLYEFYEDGDCFFFPLVHFFCLGEEIGEIGMNGALIGAPGMGGIRAF